MLGSFTTNVMPLATGGTTSPPPPPNVATSPPPPPPKAAASPRPPPPTADGFQRAPYPLDWVIQLAVDLPSYACCRSDVTSLKFTPDGRPFWRGDRNRGPDRQSLHADLLTKDATSGECRHAGPPVPGLCPA